MYNDLDYKNKVVVGLIVTLALLFFCAGVSIYQFLLPVITLKVDSVTIRQEEALPEFKVYAEYNRKKDVVLDETTGYTVKDLVDELNRGEGYQLNQNADNMTEGSYLVAVDLEEQIKEKMVCEWNLKVRYRVQNASVEVLNKYGDWEAGRFRMLDGTYASEWTNLGEDTYYFDEAGVRVTGEREIAGAVYYFGKDGKFDTQKNPVNPNRPMLALTFDDGPGNYTMRLLEELEKQHAKATFFMVGTRVSQYPDSIRKMQEIGCELANHTTNHIKLTLHPTETIANEIGFTSTQIQNIAGELPTMVRPPYGAVNEAVQAAANAPIVLWTVDTLDWESKNVDLIKNHVLNTVRDGDIVLMHDIYEASAQAAIELMPILQERGYQLVTVSEMARARGVAMENGGKYFSFYKQ